MSLLSDRTLPKHNRAPNLLDSSKVGARSQERFHATAIVRLIGLFSLFVLSTSVVSVLGQSKNIWISAQELASRPTTGEAWNQLLEAADSVDTLAVEGGHNSFHDTYTMAAALVAARLNDPARKQTVANNILKAVTLQVENDGNSLSLSRTLPGYVIAADLIDFRTFDPIGEATFSDWLEQVVYVLELDEATQVEKHEVRGNNQGTQAGVARIVSAIYLDKADDLAQAAQVFKGWLGDTTAYAGFSWGDLCWQTNQTHPVGILPQGATMFVAGELRNVDGVQPDDQRRAGCPDSELTWPPRTDVHVWGGLSGAVGQAYLLSRAGFDSWNWENQAILRSVSWQHDPTRGNAPAEDDDLWTLPLIDLFYGTNFWSGFPTKDGKQLGWTDWTHGGEKATQFTLEVEVIGQGSVQLVPPGPSFVPGTQVQVTAVPSPGWVFIGWNEDLEGLETTQTVTMDEVKEVEAIFGEAASTVLVDPKVSTTPAPDDPNDIAIWIHPTNPDKNVVIGVDKDDGIFVWDLNGNEVQSIPQDTSLNTIDLRQGVPFGGQVVDLVVANLRDAGKLAVFKVNPDHSGSNVLTQIADVNSTGNNVQVDSYGLSLYKRPSDGALFVFERPKRDGILRQYRIQDNGSGGVLVTPVRDLNYAGGKAEGFVTDDELGFLYVAEEGEAVHKFHVDPNGSPDPMTLFAIGDGITPTRQGLGLYACNDGTGYLILSSKGNSTFKIYEREGDNLFVKTVVPKDEFGNIDLGTEGLSATSSVAGANFPAGFVAAHDAINNKFHLYDWRDIAETDLNVCADGELTARPDIFVSPQSHNFGIQAVNSTASQAFSVRNDGTADLSLSSIALINNDEDEFVISNGGGTIVLAPGGTHEVSISFNPVSVGDTEATLRIVSNDPNESPFDIQVTGSGFVPRPQISVSPGNEDYGIIAIGRTELRSFTVSNTGTADLTVTSLTTAGVSSSEFTVRNSLVPFTLAPNGSLDLDVLFSPVTGGAKSAILQFQSNDLDDNPFHVALTAMATLEEPETVVLLPSDDAYIRSTRASNNYGDKNALYVRQATGIFIGYLKFSVSNLINPVTSAKIRVYVLDDGPDGGSVYQVSNNYEGTTTPWAEMGLTWANAPTIQSDPLDNVGAVALDSWVEFDVSTAITGNGTYSFAIRNANSEDIKYSSRDWTHPPELVIETAGGINPASQLVKISGDSQEATAGSLLGSPLLVEVRNDDNLPVEGVVVAFQVVAGGGSLTVPQQTTDSAGRATASWTLGSAPGENLVQVSSSGLNGSPLTFTATGLALPATQIVKVSGDNQEAVVGSELAEPFIVEVRDDNDSPIQGVSVTFEVLTGDGSLSVSQQSTDSTGLASAVLTLGNVPGTNTVEVSSSGLTGSPLRFTATGLALPATQIVKVSGDNQEAVVGSALEEPLVVEIRDDSNSPVQGVSVTFEVSTGNGSLSVSQQVTDSTGQVRSILTLGNTPGTNTVEASSSGLNGSPVVFTATGLGTPATQLIKVSGDVQIGFADSTLSEPFVVEVQDSANEPVSGVLVTFEVTSGGGSLLNGSTVVTDSTGRSRNLLKLGSATGINNVRVTSDGLTGSPLTFTAVARSLPPSDMVKVSGDNQTGFVDSTLASALTIEVRDAAGQPVGGIPVRFEITSGGGVLSNSQPQITASDGRASTLLTLGNQPGENRISVISDSLNGVELTFVATGISPPPTEMVKVSGDGQSAFVDSALAEPLVVEVRNTFGGAVSGVPVLFEIVSGGGLLSSGQPVTTGADGRASTFLTLGGEPGSNSVRVTSDSLSGVALTFSAAGLPLPPTQLVKVSGDHQSGFADSTLDMPLLVEVQNSAGQPVSGVVVNFEVVQGGGTLSVNQPSTDLDGRAKTFLTLGSLAGENQVRVTSAGLNGSPMLFSATAFAQSAAQIMKISGDNQIAFLDSALAEPLVVEVRDATGAAMAGVPITFEVTSGGGRLAESQPRVTGADGRASSTLTVGSIVGINNVQVKSDGLAGSPLFFTAIARALPPTQLVKISGDAQSAFVDSVLAEPFVIEVRNSANQSVKGVEVLFQVSAGDGTLSISQPLTDDSGRASTLLTLGGLPGDNVVRASSEGLTGSPLIFTAAGIALPPTQLVRISGDDQSAYIDSTLPEPVIVEVRNVANEPVVGVSVVFEVVAGDGALSDSSPQVTGVDGRASVVWTLGPVPGANQVRAVSGVLDGSPMTFSATALPLPPSQLLKVSGDDQVAFVDSSLVEPLVVEVRNAADEPVSGVSIVFDIVAGGGSASQDSLLTDTNGRVSVIWTLGSEHGENRVEAHSPEFESSPISFAATALALPPTQIVQVSGDNQNALVDSALAVPLVVEVRNVADNPVSGVLVTFEIVSGGGSLSSNETQVTDSEGRASVAWTLGAFPGENQLRAFSDGLAGSPVIFTATALPLPPSQLLKVSGDNQVAFVDSTLDEPLVIEVRNAADEPVSDVSVIFNVLTGDGSLTPDSLRTDANGRASVVWSLGGNPGENRAEAYSPEFESGRVPFVATATALPPTQIVKNSGDNQSAFVNLTLTAPLVAEVRNVIHEPVSGALVTFEIVSGGGSLSTNEVQVTDSEGRVSVAWTLGTIPGENQVRALAGGLAGSPVIFTATALPLPPSQLLRVSGDNQVAFVDSSLAEPLVVEVQNAASEAVPGVRVVFTVTAGGGGVSPDSVLTDANGRASVAWTLGSDLGEHSLAAHSPDFASNPIPFVATAMPLPPTQIVKVSGDNQSDFADSALSEPLMVEVRDAAERPVAGVPVTFSVILGGGQVSVAEVTTGVEGRASAVLTLGEVPGENHVLVESQGLAGSPLVFAATGLALPPKQLIQVSGNNQSALVDSALVEPFVVELQNTAGQPMPGVRISFMVVVGGGSLSASEDITDSNGRASARLTLGGQPGENRVEVLADGLLDSSVTFIATGLGLPATKLLLVSGDNQSGQGGTALVQPLVVQALDTNDEPVAGVPVMFEVMSGDGILLTPQPQLSDQEGLAAAVLVLGINPGINSVNANSEGLSGSPVSFSANGVETTAELIFTPTDDSYIRSNKPGNKYGDKPTMYVIDASTDYVCFLKFSVEGLESPVRSAKLRLKAIDGGSDGGVMHLVSNNQADSNKPWTEETLNWNNAPPRPTSALDSLGQVATGSTVEFDVMSAISGDGIYSFAVRGRTNDLVKYSSKEGSATPELVLTVGQAGGVSQLVEISGNGQVAEVGTQLTTPLVVEARDANDFAVTGVPVRFEVISGGGSLSSSQPQVTDSNGRAVTMLTLGSVAGENRVLASVEGGILPGVTFAATGLLRQFSLTIGTDGNGSVDSDPIGATHDEGTTVTLIAQPDSGWSFQGWSGDSSGAVNPLALKMDSDKSMTAIFSEIPPQQFTLAVTSEGDGSVALNPTGGQYALGTLVSVTAIADSGWVFTGWAGAAAGDTNPISVQMDSDKSLQASFSPNEAPIALGDQFTLAEDDSIMVPAPGVLVNDSDPDGDSLHVAVVSGPTNGTFTLGDDGSFSYVPFHNYNGPDQFSYTVQDGKGGIASAEVNLSVTPVNDAPVALADQYNLEVERTFSIPAPGVLLNDSDIDSHTLTASLMAGPSHGSMNLAADGSLIYTPNAGFVGADIFTYRVEDELGAGAAATVTLQVSPNEVVHEETVTGGSTESDVVTTAGVLTGMTDHVYLAAITSKPFREVSSVSGLGLDWTRVRRQCGGRNQTGMEVWIAHGSPTAESPISASFARAPKNAAISASRYSGVDATEPVGGMVSANSNGVDGPCSGGQDQEVYALDFATSAAKSRVYAAVAMRERTHSPGMGFTERAELIHGGGGAGAGLAVQDTTIEQISNLIIDGSFSSDVDWALIGLELKPGGGAAQPTLFSLNVSSEGGGGVTLSPGGGIYLENSIVTLTANPDAGWAFEEWVGDLDGSETPTTLLMNGNKTVIAHFAELPPIEFTLDVNVSGPGHVLLNPPGGTYPPGTQVTLIANPDSGASFTGWGGDVAGFQNPIDLAVDFDMAISADFVINQPPIVANDVYSLVEDDTLDVPTPGLLANDSDPDGDALTAVVVSGPTNGTLTLNPDGSFRYLPATNFNGTDIFNYRAIDKGGSIIGTVTLTVSGVNDPPIANDDAYNVSEDDTLSIDAPGLLANDNDPDADTVLSSLVSGPSNGMLDLAGDGSFSYVPGANFNGTDNFVYGIEDGNGGADSATVVLTVSVVNDLPVAIQDDFSVAEDDTLVILAPGVLANDSDPDGGQLSVALVVDPTNGTIDLQPDGSFTYVPEPDFHGEDGFTYELTDNQAGAVNTNVILTVGPINDAPLAVDDVYDVVVDGTLSVPAPGVLANDSDIEGESLSAVAMSSPSNGTLVLESDGSLVYIPTVGFTGTDSFTYGVTDSSGSASIGTVHLTVNADEIKHEQTLVGGSSDRKTVNISSPIDAVDGHLYLAAISTKPFRKATELAGLGLVWTRVREQCAGRNQTGVEIWRAIGFPNGDDVVTASFSSAPKNAAISVSRYSGVDSAAPVGNSISGNTRGLDGVCSGGSDNEGYSFGFATAQDGAVVFAAVGMRNKTHTAAVSFKERAEMSQGTGGSGAGLAVMDRLVETAGSLTVTGTFNNEVDWALIAIELRPPGSLSKSATRSQSPADDRDIAIPASYELGQNHPNPFNPTTTINFSVPKTTELSLSIYNMRGQRVRLLVSGIVKAGRHRILWNGRNEQGSKVASGIYIYRLKAEDFTAQRKLILAK